MVVSMRSEKPICAQPCLLDFSPNLALGSFNDGLIDDGPFSFFQGRSSSASSFNASQLLVSNGEVFCLENSPIYRKRLTGSSPFPSGSSRVCTLVHPPSSLTHCPPPPQQSSDLLSFSEVWNVSVWEMCVSVYSYWFAILLVLFLRGFIVYHRISVDLMLPCIHSQGHTHIYGYKTDTFKDRRQTHSRTGQIYSRS